MNKSLVIVFNSMDVGGIERKIVDLANHFQKHLQVTLILKHKRGLLLNQINPEVNIVETSLYPPFLTVHLISIKPNLILTFGNYCSICSILSAPFSKIIISEDSSIDTQIETDSFPRLRKFLVRVTYPLASSIITLTQTGKNKLTHLIPTISNKITVLPNWLPLATPKTKKHVKDIDILFLGRFEPQKNPLNFVKICQKLLLKKSNLKIVMVGSGSLLPIIKKYILNYKLPIKLIPQTTDASKYFRRSKLLLLTSQHEGFPLTILESFSCNCAVICPNLSEIISFFDFHPEKLVYSDINNAKKNILQILEQDTKSQEIISYYHHKVVSTQSTNFHATLKHLNRLL